MSEIIGATYEVLERLGAGGGGTVYLAEHLRLHKKVVLKVDKRKISTPQELLRREVDVLKNLRHANIPQVYDFFVEGDKVCTVMDYVEGESLDKALERGERFAQAQVIEWAAQLLDALIYLHSPTHGDPPKGFIHSDIKPANIMRMPNGQVCLIDFNIALALGEENIIGCSAGYSSPEHYGLDYSTSSTTSMVSAGAKFAEEQATELATDNEVTERAPRVRTASVNSPTAPRVRTVTPDVRSDIYSIGATLYHLLSGRRPDRDAQKVVPLSADDCSLQVAAIINRAMQPNPDLRFQSAAEMRQAFIDLRARDPRVIRLNRIRNVSCILFVVLFGLGTFTGFVGLKRMQTTEEWLKLAEYSKNALQEGDVNSAVEYARQAFPAQQNIFLPHHVAAAQQALTSALGVYNLADQYNSHCTVKLPSAPLSISIAPDGSTAACVYSGTVAVVDMQSGKVIAALPADSSALSEAEYLDSSRIAYAGSDGICVYDITQEKELWKGKPATGIAVSADGARVAGIYKDEDHAAIYDASTGQLLEEVNFAGKRQKVVSNDGFANPNDNLFSLDANGMQLAVSFDDGSLDILGLNGSGSRAHVLETSSGYEHFEGGFYGKYFAFSALGDQAVFAVLDTATMKQTGGYQSEYPFHVKTDEEGICVQTENILVRIDPVTGEQTPLVNTPKTIHAFAKSSNHALVATEDGFELYDGNACLTGRFETDETINFVQIAGKYAVLGSRNSVDVRVMVYENHPQAEVFTYDSSVRHDEARISADRKNLMLFSYDHFDLYSLDGQRIAEVEIPNAEEVYDQQFIRQEDESYLEVLYYDGTLVRYSAQDGHQTITEKTDPPDKDLYEIFETDDVRVESPLHGTPSVYDRKSGRKIADLNSNDYLTYITQTGDYLIAQYVTTDSYFYGQLMNLQCEVLADLPYLCDVYDNMLFFDYPTGNIRKSNIYSLQDLLQTADLMQTD